MKSRLARSTTARRPLRSVAAAVALGAALAACGDGGGSPDTAGSGASEAADDCDGYPSEDIHLVVPFNAGGGYDAWARLMAPFLEKHLGDDVTVVVDNVPGGGGVRGTNQVYMAEPDGTSYIVQSPNDLAGLQILGKTPENFDLSEMTVLGGFTEDPQVFLVSADSPVETMDDVAALPQPIRNAVTEISSVELLTYDAFGIQANFILNDGTGAAVLAVRRGDADVTAGSLSSVIGYVKSGDLKPILYIAEEAPDENVVGYDLIQDVPTIEEEGHPELGSVLTQLRVVAGPPGLPDCIRETMAEALSASLADPELVKAAEEAELQVVASSAEEAEQQVQDILDSLTENADVLKAGLPE